MSANVRPKVILANSRVVSVGKDKRWGFRCFGLWCSIYIVRMFAEGHSFPIFHHLPSALTSFAPPN